MKQGKFNSRMRYIGFILVTLASFSSCKDVSVNKSALNFEYGSDFIIKSIFEIGSGEIYCLGNNVAGDSVIILSYDSKRKLVDRINLNRMQKFHGKISANFEEGVGWLISRTFTQDNSSIVEVFITDFDFNILKENRIYQSPSSPNTYSGLVTQFDQMKDGGFVLSLDYSRREKTTNQRSNYKYKIIRLDESLNIIYDFDSDKYGFNSNRWLPIDLQVCETSSGELFYASAVITDDGYRLVFGLLENSGELSYQKVNEQNYVWFRVIGLKRIKEHILLHFFVNNQNILTYYMIDNTSGIITKELALPDLFGSSSPYSFGNPITVMSNSTVGQIVQNWEEVNLQYLTFDSELNYTNMFSLSLPKFAWYDSYRQIELKNGNLLFGITADDRGSRNFILQELEPEGEFVQ